MTKEELMKENKNLKEENLRLKKQIMIFKFFISKINKNIENIF